MKIMHPAEQIVKIISRIYSNGMTTTSGGNISVIDKNGDIWITPSAIDKGRLSEKDIVCLKSDGSIEGIHKPSSEYPFHKAIYSIRPDIKAVIHAHPPALVSFSIVHTTPDTNILPQAKQICGAIGYADYALPGSEELGDMIAAEFRDSEKMSVIMENHGTVLGGTDLLDAYLRLDYLEFCARTIINARLIGEPRYLSNEQIEQFFRHRNHPIETDDQVRYMSEEHMVRRNICEIVHRASEHGLMTGIYGSVSVRTTENTFHITPADKPCWDLDTNDIVQISDGKAEQGKKPSVSAVLHQRIYERHPGINSVIITQPQYLMAYCTTDVKFNVRTIPESWIFLQDVPVVPFESQADLNTIIPDLLCVNTPALIIENDSFLVTGDKLIQTFDRLEVAEFSAKSLILASPVGQLIPITDDQVEDLRKKFLS